MIDKILLLICSLTICTCSCTGQDYSFETKVHKEVLDSMSNLGYDFEVSLQTLNENLLNSGLISEMSGYELKRLIDSFHRNALVMNSHQGLIDSLGSELLTYTRLFNHYGGLMDTSSYNSSRWKRYKTDFGVYYDSMEKSQDISFEELVKFLSKSLSINDLEHPPYYLSPYMFLTFSDIPTGLQAQLPPIPDYVKKQKVKSKYVLEIMVNSQDELSVEGESQSIDNLKEECKRHILKYENRAIISLKNQKGTSYETYVDVFNEITRAYNEVRDEYSLRSYNKKYQDLDSKQKKEVKKIYPKKLSESEPISTQ
ncbi:MAG: biopolymer transport protein ExbD [Bacteroidia bacterium]|jgi:biopolymer transport protein ExbD